MKRRVVEWLFFFIIICCNFAFLCSLCESAFISSSEAASGHDLKPLMKEKQVKSHVFKSHERTFKGLHEALYSRDVQEEKKVIVDKNKKGKGSYGGGDLLRPRTKKSSGANLKSSSTKLLRYVMVGLLSAMFFF
ncbi:uncharacterized protein LOC111286404 [Durio zibethinus]|uniref:Uncharacterized protein LOC111286404 n=1 Tax=Durio zibethinus TaxID=66656 RepID=A0A6P5XW61_DURZI|nr:uncharacterized protein LOC111286404 [Durio zibethinus]